MSSIKRLLDFILLIQFITGMFISLQEYSQEINLVDNEEVISYFKNEEHKVKDSELYDPIEKMPQYIHGSDSLVNLIKSNLRWPNSDFCGEGTVIVSFIVDKKGVAKAHKVIRGVYPSLDQEALRVVKLAKEWIPGEQSGVLVDTQFNFPVRFRLE